eukprot:TRINITY_DN6647_c0_g1_i1.p1 TRINITY_DN6647_c0_g1~~TRINITY_DN6647_c0_g1_i1.p1  ORF type:complete len:214 (-),score=68.83 TRINITY_DN6647_c0_g1_i1:37-678(-)
MSASVSIIQESKVVTTQQIQDLIALLLDKEEENKVLSLQIQILKDSLEEAKQESQHWKTKAYNELNKTNTDICEMIKSSSEFKRVTARLLKLESEKKMWEEEKQRSKQEVERIARELNQERITLEQHHKLALEAIVISREKLEKEQAIYRTQAEEFRRLEKERDAQESVIMLQNSELNRLIHEVEQLSLKLAKMKGSQPEGHSSPDITRRGNS